MKVNKIPETEEAKKIVKAIEFQSLTVSERKRKQEIEYLNNYIYWR